VRIGATIISLLLLVGLSLAAQTADSNVPSGAGVLSSLHRPSEAVVTPGASPRTDLPGDTLHVDLEAFNNALGLTAGGVFYTAARLSPTAACTVATVVFYKWDASNDDYLFVWGKGTPTTPGPLIESVPYSGATTMAWQTINLPVLVPIAANDDIWVGPRINHSGGTYPLGVDDGPAVANRGGWINSDGRWVEVSSTGFNVNWHIRAFLGRGGIPAHNVGTELVLAPARAVAPEPVAPMARIRNSGSNPVSNIPLTCVVDSADTAVFTSTTMYAGPLAPSGTADVTFPGSWTGVVGSTYQVAMFTSLPEDSLHANDTAHVEVMVLPPCDVGAELVLAPIDTVAPEPVAPAVRIRNFGSSPASNIPLTCWIDSAGTNVFTDTTTYPGPLAPLESADVALPDSWTGVVGNSYQVTMFTSLPEDSLHANDTALAEVTVQPPLPAVEEQHPQLAGSLDNVLPTLVRDRVRINFTVARRGKVNLGVYDATGSPVRTLVNGTLEPGSQSATWDRTNSDGRRVANGTYFYRLTIDGRTVSSKSVLFN